MKPILISTGVSDYDILDKWLLQVHGGAATSSFFTAPNCEALTISDAAGPVMFARLENARRVDIQFLPDEQPLRTARALAKFIAYAKGRSDVNEFVFDTSVSALARFMSRFGAEHAPYTFRLKVRQ